MHQVEEVGWRGRSIEQVEVDELGRRRHHMEQVEEMRWRGQVGVEEIGWRGEVEEFNLEEIYRILDLPEPKTNKEEDRKEEEEEEEEQALLTTTGPLSRLLEVAEELQQSLEEGGGGGQSHPHPPAPPSGVEFHQFPSPSWSEGSPGWRNPVLDSSTGLLDWIPGLDSSVRSPTQGPAVQARTPSVIQRTPSLPSTVSQVRGRQTI